MSRRAGHWGLLTVAVACGSAQPGTGVSRTGDDRDAGGTRDLDASPGDRVVRDSSLTYECEEPPPGESFVLAPSTAPEVTAQCSRTGPLYDTAYEPGSDAIRALECRLPGLERELVATHPEFSLEAYFRQYVGLVADGRRLVYVNAVAKELFDDRWRTEPAIVCDGYDIAWGVTYDVASEQFREFAFNGFLIR